MHYGANHILEELKLLSRNINFGLVIQDLGHRPRIGMQILTSELHTCSRAMTQSNPMSQHIGFHVSFLEKFTSPN